MTIRRTPDDFRVMELMTDSVRAAWRSEPSAQAPHAVYLLTKRSMTTPEAVQAVARAVRCRHDQVGYCGLKDKHAVTTQFISAPAASAAHAAEMPREATVRTAEIRLVGWSCEPLAAGVIRGNRFTITVRDLSPAASAEMDRRARMLRDSTDGPLVFTNYFGDQRFGSARHGKGFVARELIRGEFEAALKLAIATPARKDVGRTRTFTRAAISGWGDWARLAKELPKCPERRPIEVLAGGGDFKSAFAALPYFLQSLYLEAYQSHLWNAAARRLSEAIAGDAAVRTSDDFGELVFVPSAALDEQWRSAQLPLLAKNTVLDDRVRGAAEAALADEGITQSQLRVPGLDRPWFGEAPRGLCALAEAFSMTHPEPDELGRAGRLKRTLEFELGRGSYATVLLRALGQ